MISFARGWRDGPTGGGAATANPVPSGSGITTQHRDRASHVIRFLRFPYAVENHRPFPHSFQRNPVQYGVAECFIVVGGVDHHG